jgi:hypothetical protein
MPRTYIIKSQITATTENDNMYRSILWRCTMDRKSLDFSVFLIHALAEKWGKPHGWVYQVLNDSGILDDYILPYYDVLHTQGREYLVEDITGFVNERGIRV